MCFGDGGIKKRVQSFQNSPSQPVIKTVKPRVFGGGAGGRSGESTDHPLSLGVARLAGWGIVMEKSQSQIFLSVILSNLLYTLNYKTTLLWISLVILVFYLYAIAGNRSSLL